MESAAKKETLSQPVVCSGEGVFSLAAVWSDPARPENRVWGKSQLAENSRLGFATVGGTLRLGFEQVNSRTALGMRGTLYDEGIRSRCTGKERDAETGLDEFGARYFASNMGRFMTPDWAAKPTTVPYATFGNPQSLNLYAYAGNRPVSVADADGHAPPPDYSQCDADGNCDSQPPSNEHWDIPGWHPCICDGPGGNDPSAPVPGQNGPLKPDAQITLRYPPADSTPGIEALFHAPGMAATWNNAAGAGNFFGYATLGVVGGFGIGEAAVAMPGIAQSILYGPAANRVFWSGAGYFGARAFAEMTEGSTLEMTPVGSTLEFLGDHGVPWNVMQPLWNAASSGFASGAQGPVVMFQGLNGYTGAIWNTIESGAINGTVTYIPF